MADIQKQQKRTLRQRRLDRVGGRFLDEVRKHMMLITELTGYALKLTEDNDPAVKVDLAAAEKSWESEVSELHKLVDNVSKGSGKYGKVLSKDPITVMHLLSCVNAIAGNYRFAGTTPEFPKLPD